MLDNALEISYTYSGKPRKLENEWRYPEISIKKGLLMQSRSRKIKPKQFGPFLHYEA